MKHLFPVCAVAVGLSACTYDPVDDGYQVVWEDDFDTLESTWWHAEDPGKVTAQDGVLRLVDDPAFGMTLTGSHGQRQATEPNYPDAVSFEEGYFEARIRYIHDPWAWPTFWLWPTAVHEAQPDDYCEQLTGEWDIMENGLGNADGTRPSYSTTWNVVHKNTNSRCDVPDVTRHVMNQFPDIDLSDWHVWAGRWDGTQLCTFLEGVEIGCVEAYESMAQPMGITRSVNYHAVCGSCGAQPAQVWMEVDWVRVWQLP